jgi:hypothetical protein
MATGTSPICITAVDQRTATIECNEQEVDALNTEDQRVMIRKIAAQLHIGHTAMQETMETLGYRKDFLSFGSLTAGEPAQKGMQPRAQTWTLWSTTYPDPKEHEEQALHK